MVKKIQRIRRRGEDLFEVIRKDLDSFFRHATKRLDKTMNETISTVVSRAVGEFKNPRSDITQNDKQVEINVHLPNVKKQDIVLKLTKDHLEVSAEHSAHKKQKKINSYTETQEFKGFKRVIPLPPDVNVDNAKASFSNETLKLVIPKLKKKQKLLVIR